MAAALAASRGAARLSCAPRAAARRPTRLASHVEEVAVSAFPDKIIKQRLRPEQLKKRGVFEWPTWSCEVSKFDWTYNENEDALILEGRVIVVPDGGQPTELVAGDFAIFPQGMSCVWDVTEPIKKHYRLHV